MKALYLIFIIIIMSNIIIKGQDYVPFPTNNASWNIALKHGCISQDTLVRKYTLSGDTIIKGISYHTLYVDKGDTLNPDYYFMGGLREDDKRVYYYGYHFLSYVFTNPSNLDGFEETLLYDFTKNTGDTIHHDLEYYSTILGIDSIKINGSFRKRYEVKNHSPYYQNDFIVEGIGSIKKGLLGHITPGWECGSHYWEHICFVENEIVKYLNPTFNECFPSNLFTGIAQSDSETRFDIYPNPCYNELHIENRLNNQELIFRLIDINGKIVIKESINYDKVTIRLNIKTGLYYALIHDKNGTLLMTKLVIKE